MRPNSRRATCTLAATATTFLVAVPLDSASPGQARGSLQVTVQVVAACGGTNTGGQVVTTDGCAPGSAPMAILSEPAAATRDPAAPTAASVEDAGEVRYVTLIY